MERHSSKESAGKIAVEIRHTGRVCFDEVQLRQHFDDRQAIQTISTSRSKSSTTSDTSSALARRMIEKVTIGFDSTQVSSRNIFNFLQTQYAHITLVPTNNNDDDAGSFVYQLRTQERKLRRRFVFSLMLSVPIVILSTIVPEFWTSRHVFLWNEVTLADVVCFLCATPVQVVVAQPLVKSALSSIVYSKLVNRDVLIVLSSVCAYGLSCWDLLWKAVGQNQAALAHDYYYPTIMTFEVSALLLTFVSFGRMIEHWAQVQTSASIRRLLSLQVKTAILVSPRGLKPDESEEQYIDMELVQRGDRLKILPGARVPTGT